MIDMILSDDWNRFLDRHKGQVTVFHTQEWMVTLQKAFGYRPKYLVDGDSVMPFMVDTRFGIDNYFSMPYDTYGGVIGDTNNNLIDQFANLPGIGYRYYVDYHRLDQKGVGFTKTIETTELLDITKSTDYLWDHMEHNNRKHIKAAKKTCSYVAKTPEDFQIVENLLTPTKDIHGGGVSPKLLNSMKTNMGEYYVPYITKVDDVPMIASIFLKYGDMVNYWAMGLHNTPHAHYSLIWQVIYDFKLQGTKVLNLGSTPKVTTTVLPWKHSWGTTTHRYYIYRKVPTLLKPILWVKEVLNEYLSNW